MKSTILKLAGVKDEKALYAKYKTEEAFLKAHGRALEKAMQGKNIEKAESGWKGVPFSNAPAYQPFDPTKGQFQDIINPDSSKEQQDVSNDGLAKSINKFSPLAGSIGQGIVDLIGEKTKRKSAEQWAKVSDVVAKAASLKPEEQNRKYIRPEDMQNTGGEFFPIYGVGTNVLAKDGKKIKPINTKVESVKINKGSKEYDKGFSKIERQINEYAPELNMPNDTIFEVVNNAQTSRINTNQGQPILQQFSSTGYNRLPKEEEVPMKNFVNSYFNKQLKDGGEILKMLQGSGNTEALSNILSGISGENAGGNLGSTLGGTAGKLTGIPGMDAVGSLVGQGIGTLLDRNPARIKTANNHIKSNMMKIGMGNQFGGVQQQYSSFMRTGGNLRQNTLDGDLQVYNGEAEPISYNPYSESETIMFRGPSHEDGGMPITYGDSPVEVEGGEPAVKMDNGGEQEDLVVFGNLQIPKNMLQDKNANGKKFKTYIKDLAKVEDKQNKLMDKSTNMLNNISSNTSFDKLKLSSLKANMLGANMKLKDIAEKKKDAAALQSAINETAEENNLVADDLAKGNIKIAKKGLNVPKNKGEGNKELEDAMNTGWSTLKNVLPYFRPSDAEEIDPRQFTGEMFALSNNQLEPVYSQSFSPELTTPYNISLQDILNENNADFRSTQKMVGDNPVALAILNAQKYGANQKVLGEQFRQNQAEKAKVFEQNRNILNQAKLQNLGILDQQQTKQAQAKSNTKAITQKALESISNKYLQNQLQNRTLQTYENMYNYRYDNKGRAINMNAPYEWNTEGNFGYMNAPLAKGKQYSYTLDDNGNFVREDIKAKPKSGRNDSLVKSLKNY